MDGLIGIILTVTVLIVGILISLLAIALCLTGIYKLVDYVINNIQTKRKRRGKDNE